MARTGAVGVSGLKRWSTDQLFVLVAFKFNIQSVYCILSYCILSILLYLKILESTNGKPWKPCTLRLFRSLALSVHHLPSCILTPGIQVFRGRGLRARQVCKSGPKPLHSFQCIWGIFASQFSPGGWWSVAKPKNPWILKSAPNEWIKTQHSQESVRNSQAFLPWAVALASMRREGSYASLVQNGA